MPSKYAPRTLGEARDAISWAWATAPQFKGQQSLDEVFDDIESCVSRARNKARKSSIGKDLDRCLEALSVSRAAFKENDLKLGHQELFKSGQILRSLGERKAQAAVSDSKAVLIQRPKVMSASAANTTAKKPWWKIF